MARYSIYQNDIRQMCNFINRLGWDEASKQSEKVEAHLNCSNKGSEAWKTSYQSEYTHVADVEAESLDDVFTIGNIGPERLLTRLQPMHSVSVGDMIIAPTGRAYMVDPYGFAEIEILEDM